MADDFIIVEPYSPEWLHLAQQEITKLTQLLAFPWLVGIEHIGSTAVPGLAAKPIVDIAIGVTDLEAARALVPILEQEDYLFWAENPDPTRFFFVKGMPPFGERRTHHIHVMSSSHHEWVVRPLFRDYLIAHPDVKQAYADLKQDLALNFREDREAYTEAKTEFIRRINREAIKPYLQFKRLAAEDLPLLQSWFHASHVKAWWDHDMAKYTSRLAADSPVKCFIITIGNVPVGFIQHYPSEFQENAEGVDFFMGNPTFMGKGLGAFLLSEFMKKMLPEKNVVVAPDVKNIRAIQVYERAGFKKVLGQNDVVWMLWRKKL